jgi:hypothetical protein
MPDWPPFTSQAMQFAHGNIYAEMPNISLQPKFSVLLCSWCSLQLQSACFEEHHFSARVLGVPRTTELRHLLAYRPTAHPIFRRKIHRKSVKIGISRYA